jgi:hypothetical protein
MGPTMSHRGIDAVRADALFVSALQPSQNPGLRQVRQAVAAAARQFGAGGCAGLVAQEFGEHPQAAAARMRWALPAVAEAYGRRGVPGSMAGRPWWHGAGRAA